MAEGISMVTICKIGIGQKSKVIKLLLDIFSGEPWNDDWTDGQIYAYVEELMGNKNSLCFGLFKNGILTGIALGRIKSWYQGKEFFIEEFGISPSLQCSGLGSEFMCEIEKALAAEGLSYITLLTDKRVPAYHFYLKNGFSEQNETVFFAKRIKKEDKGN